MKKVQILDIIAYLFVGLNLVIDFMSNISLSVKAKLFVYILSILLIFVNMKIQNKKLENDEKEKNIRKGLLKIFIVYSILIMTLLFLDGNFRMYTWRKNVNIFSKEYFQNFCNIVPFSTIINFFDKSAKGYLNTRILITNILGNILIFAPYGFFLPTIFEDKFKSSKNFILGMIVIVFVVEVVQFLTGLGSFDIDDIILNTLGAVMVFLIFKVEKINIFIKNICK